MFDPVAPADQIKPHLSEREAVTVLWLLGKLDAVVSQDHVYPVRR